MTIGVLGPDEENELARFNRVLELETGFAFHVLVAETKRVLDAALARLTVRIPVVRPRPLRELLRRDAATEILLEINHALDAAKNQPLLIDAMNAHRDPAWIFVFQRLNELRNGLEKRHQGLLLLALTPAGERVLGQNAPDLWSKRGSGMRLRDQQPPPTANALAEAAPEPPQNRRELENLCFELFKEIWNDPGTQRYGRISQPNTGVDIFGKAGERWIGVQCRPGALPTPRELELELAKAKTFEPRLAAFMIASTAKSTDVALREYARTLSSTEGIEVQVWSWDDIWQQIRQRPRLVGTLFSNAEPQAAAQGQIPISEARSLPEQAIAAILPFLSGDRTGADLSFRTAEKIQKDLTPAYPLLRSNFGYWYCTFLLDPVEFAVFHGGRDPASHREVCRAVERRAAQILEWAELDQEPLQDVALAHLTLARTLLLADQLDGRQGASSTTREELEEAFRLAIDLNHIELLMEVHLLRATYRHFEGDLNGARADLDEAARLAESIPASLVLADIALYRARFFGDRDALAEARRRVEELNYGRRRQEIALLETRFSQAST